MGTAGTSAATQNATNLTISTGLSVAGNIEAYGSNISLGGSLTVSSGTANRILVKALGGVTSSAAFNYTTVGGDITFWADADASTSGNIWLVDSNSFATSGGRVTLAGGADDGGSTVVTGRAAGDGYPDGFAWGTGATTIWNENNRGVMLSSSNTINTSGGSVFIAGHGPNQFTGVGGQGVVLGRATRIAAGSGKIAIFGVTNATGTVSNAFNTGVEMQGYGGTAVRPLTISSSNGSSDAIEIRGDASASTSEASPGVASASFETRTTAPANYIANIGAGGVIVTGRGGTTPFNSLADIVGDGVEFGGMAVLAKSGPIVFTGDTSASSSGRAYGFSLDHTTMPNYATTPSFIGALSAGSVESVDMSTSTSNVTFNVDSLYNLDVDNTKSLLTSGAVTIQPARSAQSFDRDFSFKGFAFASNLSGLTIGSAGTSASTQTASAITMDQATSVAGPIAIYGGAVSVNQNLTASTANGSIAINSNGLFTNSAA
ncbi:MAG: hypothetical protein ORN27_04910, partial [Rhodoluna sp.]|nr:hypothetical protein [Rhodoluna sp.]